MAAYVIYPTGEQEKVIKAFMEALEISFVTDSEDGLPPHVIAGIARGQADIDAGRVVTLEDFKRKFLLD